MTLPTIAAPRSGPRTTATDANPYRPAPARIMRVRELAPETRLYDLRFEDPQVIERFRHRPGQFVELSVLGVGEGPFSLPSSPTRPGILQLGIRRAGSLTSYLFDHVKEGDTVGLRGPLGNGFPVENFRHEDVLLIAGGLGMVPLRGLLQYLVDLRHDFGRITLLYGSRRPGLVLFRDELEAMTRRGDATIALTVDATDDEPWDGEVGYVTDLFDKAEVDPSRTHAAVCGPPVFYKFMLDKLVNAGFTKNRIFLNLERRMECGVGKCGHCAVGYTFTCLHGPVFTYWDALNLPELIHD
jgi:NAD(P)H-flavin reductase